MLQAQSTIQEAEIVKQNEQHWCAAHFGINSQNYNFFDEGLSKDNLLQSGEKRSEQSDLQFRTTHPNKITQTTNFFSAGLSKNILVQVTGLEPAREAHQILNLARLPIPPYLHCDYGNICKSICQFFIVTSI